MTEEQFDKLVSGISRVAYVKSFSRKPSEEFPFHQFVINLNEDDAYHTHIQVIDAELRQLGFEQFHRASWDCMRSINRQLAVASTWRAHPGSQCTSAKFGYLLCHPH